jgi:creatinine amidohydrolase/Fe(II)-dependent formamide hydrolase-like protein
VTTGQAGAAGSRSRELAWLTTAEIAAMPKEDALVVLPIGSIEQHGPHLPCLTDTLLADRVSTRAVQALPDDANVYLLPALTYGKSNEHSGRPGTITLSAETLIAVCRDIARSVAASGFRKIAFVNGHGGQPALLEMVARDIRQETGLYVFPLNVYGLGLPEGVDVPDADFGIHGGMMETSVILALERESVRTDRYQVDGENVGKQFDAFEHLTLEGRIPTAWLIDDVSTSGVLGDPRTASAEIGQRVVDHWTRLLGEALLEMSSFEFTPL